MPESTEPVDLSELCACGEDRSMHDHADGACLVLGCPCRLFRLPEPVDVPAQMSASEVVAEMEETLNYFEECIDELSRCDGIEVGVPMATLEDVIAMTPALLAELRQLRQGVVGVRAVHFEITADRRTALAVEAAAVGFCWGCNYSWRCPTIRALEDR